MPEASGLGRSAWRRPLPWRVLLAGALQAASLAWPLAMPAGLAGLGLSAGQPVWWAQTMALALLVGWLDRSADWRVAAWGAWLFALAWMACTLAWLFTSMHTYGGLAAPLAVLAVLLLSAFLALFYAAGGAMFQRLRPVRALPAALLFAALWLLAELARGRLLTGFGWGAIAYAQLDGPLASLIPWLGVYGVGAVAAGLAAWLALAWRRARWRGRWGRGVLLLAMWLGLSWLPAPSGGSAGQIEVTLLQGNVAQDEKFDMHRGVAQSLRWYGERLQASASPLIITPETALPLLPEQLPDGYWRALQQRFATGRQAALVGVPLGSFSEGYTNSVVGFKPDQVAPWRYDKHHLVPFGEFIPPFFRWFTDLMQIPLGDFNRGALPQPTFDWLGQRLAATICYENLFSEELATQFTDAARAPTILVNLSNLAWFGDSLAMDQHLQIARMRALEFGRPFLLATNTGHTAIVDHRAQVTHRAPTYAATALHGQVEGRTGLTPYAFWVARWGLWPATLLALGVVLLAWRSASRRTQQPGHAS